MSAMRCREALCCLIDRPTLTDITHLHQSEVYQARWIWGELPTAQAASSSAPLEISCSVVRASKAGRYSSHKIKKAAT